MVDLIKDPLLRGVICEVNFTYYLVWITSAMWSMLSSAEVILMAKNNKQGANVQKASQGQFGTEFASETNAQKVKQQNNKAAQGQSQGQSQFGTEFASETEAQKVRKQNQKSQQNKQ